MRFAHSSFFSPQDQLCRFAGISQEYFLSSFADTYDGGGGVPPRATAHFSAAEKCSKYVAVVALEKLM